MNEIATAPRTALELRPRLIPVLGRLGAHRRAVFGGLAVALLVVASTFGRPWLEALGIGSAILSLLPCAAMCAAGLCVGRGSGSCAKQNGLEPGVRLDRPSAPP